MKKFYVLALMAICQFAFPQMIAKYDLNGNANDLSGNGHNGTLMNGTTYVTDRNGNFGAACAFNGSNNYIDLGNIALNNTPLTISLWSKRASVDNAAHCLLGQSSNQVADNSLNLMITELINPPFQSVGFDIYADGIYDTTGASSLNWENWCYVFDGTGYAFIYRNGQVIKSGLIGGAYVGSGNVYIGTTGWISDFFYGSIDDIRIWGQVLNGTQVDSIYQAEKTTCNGCGLLAWYDFSGNTNDISGNGHNAINNGALLNADRFGNPMGAYNFDGSSWYMDCGNIPLNANSFSIGFWSERSATDLNYHAIVSQGTSNTDDGLHVGFTGANPPYQNVGFDFFNDGVYDTTGAGSLIWNHWFFTYDYVGSNVSIFRNGQLVTNAPLTGPYTGTGNMLIGKTAWGSNYFSGMIDEVMIYGQKLTAGQVDSIYQSQKPSCASLGLSSTITNVTCHAMADGMVSITSTSGITPFAYAWTGGQTSNPATGLSGGNYTVVVTDGVGCKDSVSMFINEPAQITTVLSSTSTTCYGGTDGIVDAQVGGGTPPYMLSWSPVNATTATVTNLNAGTYTCTINDANDCSAWDSVTVYQPAQMSANMTVTSGTVCQGQPDTLNVTVNGGFSPYTYQWHDYTSGHTDTTLNNSFVIEPVSTGSTVAGVYVFDSMGCQAYASGYFWTNMSDSLSGTVTEPNSNPVTNAKVYLIKQKITHVGLGDTLASVPVDAAGHFYVQDLFWGDYFLKVVPDSLTYPTSIATYYSNRTYPFQWDSALVIQHHTCVGVNDAGKDVTIIEITPQTGSGTITGHISITQGFGQRYIGGGFAPMGAPLKGVDVKLGRNPGGSPAARTMTDTSGNYTFTNVDNGSYKIYVDIPNYGMDSARVVEITPTDTVSTKNDYYVDSATVHVVPHYYINTVQSICYGDSVFAGGAYQHINGTYYDSLTTSMGADSILVLDLTVNPLPNVTASTSADTICLGGSVTLTGTGAQSYSWTNGVTDGVAFNPTQTETYTVIGSDVNGCMDSTTITVAVKSCAGIENFSKDGLTAYPNPSNAVLMISSSDMPRSIEVQSITGEKVMEVPVTGTKTQADISKLAPGAYMVKVQLGGNGTRYLKILKQ